jgi:hypothetical protein
MTLLFYFIQNIQKPHCLNFSFMDFVWTGHELNVTYSILLWSEVKEWTWRFSHIRTFRNCVVVQSNDNFPFISSIKEKKTFVKIVIEKLNTSFEFVFYC